MGSSEDSQPKDAASAEGSGIPDTYYAPAERASAEALEHSVRAALASPVITALLENVSGCAVVLNRQRQIIAVNDRFLRARGVSDVHELLGLRPGEALHCAHAADHPGGCGTSRFCATCGAAIAIVVSQARGEPVERECILTSLAAGGPVEIDFVVRSSPLHLEGHDALLVVLQDVSADRRREGLQQAFMHDLTNYVGTLSRLSEQLDWEDAPTVSPSPRDILRDITARFVQELRYQRLLSSESAETYQVHRETVSASTLVDRVRQVVEVHQAANGRHLQISVVPATITLVTDAWLVERLLVNLLVNAFEACPSGETVQLGVRAEPDAVVFNVHNPGSMPPEVAMRVFQRYFTTHSDVGRGQGTFIVRLFAETLLGGKVDFETSAEEGTTFRVRLPG